MNAPAPSESGHARLKPRHVTMIAFGGVIGAGLFVGSSAAIADAGPGVILTYAMTGLMMMVIMRLLGEMLLSRPGLGSFIDYVRAGLGDWAGYLCGWLYFAFWATTIGSEAIAGAILLHDWVPLPVWLLATSLMLAVGIVNLTAIGVFGECEFWLSLIKIVCIIGFCLIAVLYLTGLIGGHPTGWTTLAGHGGWIPHGWTALASALPTVIFSMGGSEIATVAAAESKDAQRSLTRVIRSIGTRITLFYVFSVALILCVTPWNNIQPGHSPFVMAMATIGVPGATIVIRIVVLSAVISCLNSALFVAARSLHGLALHGDAPRQFGGRSATGAPRAAVLATSTFGLFVAFSSILAPGPVFAFLLSATGALSIFVYLLVVLAHLAFLRQGMSRNASSLPLHPVADLLALAAMGGVMVAMAIDPEQRSTLVTSLATAAVMMAGYGLMKLTRRRVAAHVRG